MSVNVPAPHRDVTHPFSGRRVSPRLLALDEHLFNPHASQWFAIDTRNTVVPGVAVTSLNDGLKLVGRGRVAALVGHLRDGVGVVDVDVPGDLGTWFTVEIADWLRRCGCWVLERPSGGAKGRSHVFFAHPEYHYAPARSRTGLAAEITRYLEQKALDVRGVRAGELDLRDAVRPLSSPHRHGAITKPKGDLEEALRDLRTVLPALPASTPLRKRRKIKRATKAAANPNELGTVIPLTLARFKRDLRPDWHRYLLNGVVPAGAWSAKATMSREAVDVDRSLVEAACTREMVWAIGDPDIAWRIVSESHPSAMTKAKHQGRAWWVDYVWNPTVRSAAGLSTSELPQKPRRSEAPPAEVVRAVAAGRVALQELMWTVPARQRPSLLQVGHQLLDRALRDGALRVPCPERNLLVDCGLGSRNVVRVALRLLNGRVGTLHTACLSRTERDSTSYEFEFNAAEEFHGRQSDPPALDPPPAPPGLWHLLPRTSHSLWRALLSCSEPADLPALTQMAGVVESPEDLPSKSQKATTKEALLALAKAGLARVDENGRWSACSRPRSVLVEEAAADLHGRQMAKIEAERAEYRAGVTSSWLAGRARAIKAAIAREKAWWEGLSSAERTERIEAKRLEFTQMSITQRAELKSRLAERRIKARLEELGHYRSWLDGLSPDELARRSHEHQRRYKSLAPAERARSVASWNRHRIRYGLPLHSPAAGASEGAGVSDELSLLPDTSRERTEAFLYRQVDRTLPGLERASTG